MIGFNAVSMKIFDFITNRISLLIPIILLAGYLKGIWFPAEYSKILSFTAMMIMLIPIFINQETGKGFKEIKHSTFPILLALVFNFILYPLLAFILGWLFLRNMPPFWLGMSLLALIPTGGMSINWTYFTKGNVLAVMTIINLSLLFSFFYLPFIIPFLADWIIQQDNIQVNTQIILEKLLTVLLLPFIAGWIIRTLIINVKDYSTFEKLKPVNNAISSTGLLMICFMVMSLKTTQMLRANLEALFIMLVPVLLYYLIVFTAGHYVGRALFNKENALAFFFGTANRYHVITLAIVLSTFKDFDFIGSIAIVIILALTIQIPLLALYATYIGKNNESQKGYKT
jgi:ACR3 family arsenite efflux pump ArsB